MKCPLTYEFHIGKRLPDKANMADCLKEECAWWDRTAEKCVVLQLAFEIDEVHDRLERILDKMPHEEQSKK